MKHSFFLMVLIPFALSATTNTTTSSNKTNTTNKSNSTNATITNFTYGPVNTSAPSTYICPSLTCIQPIGNNVCYLSSGGSPVTNIQTLACPDT